MSDTPQPPVEIFLSYAREDAARAEALAQRLETDGFAVWWDVDLRGGQDFRTEIRRSIARVSHLVVLWSEASIGSHFVIDEAGLGRESGKLVPVRIDPVEVPLGFGGLHTLEYDGSDADYARLRRALMPAVVPPNQQPAPEVPTSEMPTSELTAPEGPAQRSAGPPARRRRWLPLALGLGALLGLGGAALWAADRAHQAEIDTYIGAARQYEAAVTDYEKTLQTCVDSSKPSADTIRRKTSQKGKANCPSNQSIFVKPELRKDSQTIRITAPKGYYLSDYKVTDQTVFAGKISDPKVRKKDDQGRPTEVAVHLTCVSVGVGNISGFAKATLAAVIRHGDVAGLNRDLAGSVRRA